MIVIILKGVYIVRLSIIDVGTILTKDVPPYSLGSISPRNKLTQTEIDQYKSILNLKKNPC